MNSDIAALIKRAVRRLLASRGYVLIKQPNLDRRTGKGNIASAGRLRRKLVNRVYAPPLPRPPVFWPSAHPDLDVDAKRYFKRSWTAIHNTLPAHAAPLFASIHALSKANIFGDIVDCGEGNPVNLALIAAAFVTLADTGRHLILFDVAGDAAHRPEVELLPWGSDQSDLIDDRVARRAGQVDASRPLPHELTATGYPPPLLSVLHYPIDSISAARQIAYLGLTTDSYESNRAAIRSLMPRVVPGGVIAVTGGNGRRPSQLGCVQHGIDAVAQYLCQSGVELTFWQATPDFRLAVNKGSVNDIGYKKAT